MPRSNRNHYRRRKRNDESTFFSIAFRLIVAGFGLCCFGHLMKSPGIIGFGKFLASIPVLFFLVWVVVAVVRSGWFHRCRSPRRIDSRGVTDPESHPIVFEVPQTKTSGITESVDKSARQGKAGESLVSRLLMEGLDGTIYQGFEDVMVADEAGKTTQIDHLIVSPFGIFVIEVKNFKGTIYGDMSDAEWCQVLYSRQGREVFRFQNPFRQNFRHVCVLSDSLGIPRDYFHSIVVFGDMATVSCASNPDLVSFDDLIPRIRSYAVPMILPDQVPEIMDAIRLRDRMLSDETKASHVSNLKQRHGIPE